MVDDLITPADAARLRGVSRATMSYLIKQGRFEVHTIGGRPFVSRAEVLSFEPSKGGRPPKVKNETGLKVGKKGGKK